MMLEYSSIMKVIEKITLKVERIPIIKRKFSKKIKSTEVAMPIARSMDSEM
jgi:hypothetical protein